MFLSFVRVIKFSLQDMARNIWLSLVTVIILILALFTVNMLLVIKVVGNTAINAVKEKVDVSIYLLPTATDEEILNLRKKIENLPEVKEVKFISKTEALENFKQKHKENAEILQSLAELGINPLAATLVIKPRNLDELKNLIAKLNTFPDKIIESRNFTNYQTMLDKINSITNKVSEAGLMLSAVFLVIVLLVMYNSVRVAIYTHRREIQIMKLVGASNFFIVLPYLLSSIFFTLIAVMAVMAIFFIFLSLLQPYLETFFIGYNVNLLNYFKENLISIFGLEFLFSSVINIIASGLAVRKYSKI